MLPGRRRGPMTTFRFLDHGLDEMAAGARKGFPPRLVPYVVVGAIVSNFLPWPVCVAWALWVAGWDGLSWFWTRDQQLGLPVSDATRLKHVACVIAGVSGWSALGAALWMSGSAAGAICGVVLWLAVLGFAQVHAYQSRAGYLLSGVIPAATALV